MIDEMMTSVVPEAVHEAIPEAGAKAINVD